MEVTEASGRKRKKVRDSFFLWFEEAIGRGEAGAAEDPVADIFKEQLWPNPQCFYMESVDVRPAPNAIELAGGSQIRPGFRWSETTPLANYFREQLQPAALPHGAHQGAPFVLPLPPQYCDFPGVGPLWPKQAHRVPCRCLFRQLNMRVNAVHAWAERVQSPFRQQRTPSPPHMQRNHERGEDSQTGRRHSGRISCISLCACSRSMTPWVARTIP